jgi:fatty acid desaturase
MVCWTFITGIGFWYWYDRHSRHHAQTNDAAEDPDLQGAGLIAHRTQDAQGRRGLARRLTRYQAWIYFGYSPLIAFAFRTEGWVFAISQLRGRRQYAELGLLVISTTLWAAPFFVLGWPWLSVFLISQTVAGLYLGLIIAPNHKGMPVWTRAVELTFLERQVLGSRNVAPHPVWDFLFGGLNYQVEHHLFPTMPRSHFRRARDIVRPYCAAHSLPYTEAGAFASFRLVFAALDRVGRTVDD